MRSLNNFEYLYFVDLETTGFKGYPDDLILEVGIVQLNLKSFEEKVVLNTTISYDLDNKKIYDIISNCWLVQNGFLDLGEIEIGQSLIDVQMLTRDFLNYRNWTCWYSEFDFDINLQRWQVTPPVFDLMKVTQRMRPNLNSYKLERVYNLVSLELGYTTIKQPHRSIGDCKMEIRIFKELFNTWIRNKKKE